MGLGDSRRRSAASTSAACARTPCEMRLVKKPTAVRDSTATVSASSSTDSSPDLRSRHRLRNAKRSDLHQFTVWPASSSSTRSQRLASARSCVTSTRVLPRAAIEFEQQIGDALPGGGVQIAGGLIREQHGRMRHEGARDRDALLLAAGQLLRIVRHRAASVPLARARSPPTCRASRRPPSSSGSMTFSMAVSDGIR